MSGPGRPDPRKGMAFLPPVQLWTALPPTEVEARLTARANTVTPDSFIVGTSPPGAHLPRMAGHYQAASGGTYIEIQPTLLPQLLLLILALLVFIGPFALLVIAVLFYGRYTNDNKAIEAMRSRLRIVEEGEAAVARLRGHEVSDPTSQGAVAGAPPGFAVRAGFDRATFHLHGSGRRRTLDVSQQGLRLERASGPLRVDWVDLDDVDLQQGMLFLNGPGGTETIDLVDHSEEDRIWLAVYLQTCNQRWSPSRQEHDRERARLARLAKERGPT